MTTPEPRRRVGVALTRDTPAGPELLVFDHRDHPDAGTQLPGGGIDDGESQHTVEGDGDDRGLVYLCRFVPVRDAIGALVDRQGEFLAALDHRSGPANAAVPPETPRS